jgi:enoyl-CoA hydratase/carnithine racemase
MADVELSRVGRVALIRLNRPQTLNALTLPMLGEIRRIVREAEADAGVTAICFTGEGRGFCSGLDASALVASTEGGSAGQPTGGPDLPGMFSYLTAVKKPVISAVGGVAAGGGFVLAMMSDLRFGSEAASFTTVFSKRGLIAEHGTSWVLPRLVGLSRALDLMWSSRRIGADEAYRVGLLDRVVPAEGLIDAVVAYADDLAANISPNSIAVMKAQLYRHAGQDIRPALEESDELTRNSLDHPDAKEGATALIERRAPKFQPL